MLRLIALAVCIVFIVNAAVFVYAKLKRSRSLALACHDIVSPTDGEQIVAQTTSLRNLGKEWLEAQRQLIVSQNKSVEQIAATLFPENN